MRVPGAGGRWLLALLAGACLPLALAPFNLWPIGLLSVALCWWLLHQSANARRPGRQAAMLGWCYGLGKYGLGVSWVYVSIHDHGHAAMPLAVALVLLFVMGMALFPLAMALLFSSLQRRSKAVGAAGMVASAALFAALFVLLDWALTWVLTGFPWLFLGYGLLDTPLGRGLAPLGGVLLVELAATITALTLAVLLLSWRRRGVAGKPVLRAGLVLLPALLFWAVALVGSRVAWTSTAGPALSVVLVQGNIDQEVKWRPESVADILATYQRLSEEAWGADLVLWPEAAITLFRHQAGDFLDAMGQRAAPGALVLGIPAWEQDADGQGNGSFRNTAVAVGNGSGTYRKRRLVPFGEYVPLEHLLRGLIVFFDLPMSRSGAGPDQQLPLLAAGTRLGMAICYEIAYPDLVRRSAEQAQVLVTVSNDSWFGDSIGPRQHMQMARMRALENGRWLLRATNNGITAIVDPMGRVVAEAPRNLATVLTGEVVPRTGQTPWMQLGNLLVLGFCGALVLAVAVSARWRVGASVPG